MIPNKSKVAEVVARMIVAQVADPNGWNLTARRIAERLNLKPSRIAFHPVLDSTVWALVDEAEKQGLDNVQIITACNDYFGGKS